MKRFSKMKITSTDSTPVISTSTVDELPAPPRPPKPSHMSENPGHNYLNLDGATESSKPTTPATPATPAPTTPVTTNIVTDESHEIQKIQVASDKGKLKQYYANAVPSANDDRIFRYDFNDDEPPSPRWENPTIATYSNLPSPLIKEPQVSNITPNMLVPPPPMVYRELKPRRKTSDSNISNEPSPGPTVTDLSSAEHSPAEPPSINRKLKPQLNKCPSEGPLQLASPPGKSRIRAAPSPTLPSNYLLPRHSTSDEDNVQDKEEIYFYQERDTFIPAPNKRLVVLQYLDLDLKTTENFSSPTLSTSQSSANSTVYKTVDFLKTEAFNRTRQRVEAERKQCTDELT